MSPEVALALALAFGPRDVLADLSPRPNAGARHQLAAEVPPIRWASDYAAALIQSKAERRPLLIYVTAPACFWCTKLEMATFPDERVRREALRFVCLKLDAWKQPQLAERLWARRYPTIVLAAPDGTILSHEEGFAEPAPFAARLFRGRQDAATVMGEVIR